MAKQAAKNTLKRICSDIKSLEDSPVYGVSAALVDASNMFLFHCNIMVNEGPYKGMIVHMILRLPEGYPHVGPAGDMATGFPLTHKFHEHIHGGSICTDMLSNFKGFFSAETASGWNSGYSVKSVLQQMSIFFSDPDYPAHMMPTDLEIKAMMEVAAEYKCPDCNHTSKNPVPEIVMEVEKKEVDLVLQQTRDRLTCGVMNTCLLDDPKMILGYPIMMNRDKFDRRWTEPVTELISYDAFMGEIQSHGADKLDNYDNVHFASPMGKAYNNWMPVYISREHFERGKSIITNAITVFKFGVAGKKEYDFKPEYVLEIFTGLLNKTVVQLMNGELHQSDNAIYAYCHLLRLLMAFIDEYPSIQRQIEADVKSFVDGKRSKKDVSDIGEFIIKLSLSKRYSYEDVKKVFLEEYWARQIIWMVKKGVNIGPKMNIQTAFDASDVSNKLLVFNLEMAKCFILIDGVKEKLDKTYGFVPDNVLTTFKERIVNIKGIRSYNILIQAIQAPFTVDQVAQKLINARHLSLKQGYENKGGGHGRGRGRDRGRGRVRGRGRGGTMFRGGIDIGGMRQLPLGWE